MAKVRDPLEPAATTVYMVVAFVAALLVLGGVVGVFLSDDTPFGIGSPSVCVETRTGIVPVPTTDPNVVMGVRDGVTSNPQIVNLCTGSATVGQRILDGLARWPTTLVAIGGLLLAVRLFRFMRRHGIFVAPAAGRIRVLGWYILLGELAASLIEALARAGLITSMMREPRFTTYTFDSVDVSFLAVFLGVALISVARIMRISVAMREDLEGTV